MRILIIDDEPVLRLALAHDFKSRGWDVTEAGTCAQALVTAKEQNPEVIVLDVRLPDGSGLDLVRKLKTLNPYVTVIMLTAWGNIPSAVEAMKLGADHYLTKPADLEEIALLVSRAESTEKLRREMEFHRQRAGTTLIGSSPQMAEVRRLIDLVAGEGATTVLVQGESGTGKELVARQIHRLSNRSGGPFIDINCAGLAPQLLESELFGYERGAFTDAKARKAGLFEIAHHGTLFLDEIGEMDVAVQAKLLRALENRSFRRLGGTAEIAIDVRLVAATNRELQAMVKEGRFRADLFYRLNVFPIKVPSLRERRGDIAELSMFFVQQLGVTMHKTVRGVSRDALAVLQAYDWPGNVRELRNVVERAMILTRDGEIRPEHLSIDRAAGPEGAAAGEAGGVTLEDMERVHIQRVLASQNGNISSTARLLDISRSTLQLKLRKYGLENPGA